MTVEIDLSGKRALVTGGLGGIGYAVVQKLADAGCHGAIFDIVDKEKETTFNVDVSDPASVEEGFRKVRSTLGGLDILVNCAGVTADDLIIGNPSKGTRPMTAEQFRRVIEVNLTGTFLCLQQAALRMQTAGNGGVIVNISSISSEGNAGQANYAASKAGVIALTRTAAQELARYDIRVNAIAPGPVDTNMIADVPDAIMEGYVKRTPLRKKATPQDIANEVLWLVSPLSSHVTGDVHTVSGGLRF